MRPEGLKPHIKWSDCELHWTRFELCLAYAMMEYPESPEGGYVFVGDDTLFDPCQMEKLNRSKFWTPELSLISEKDSQWGELELFFHCIFLSISLTDGILPLKPNALFSLACGCHPNYWGESAPLHVPRVPSHFRNLSSLLSLLIKLRI
jgi:hypothetical protein